MALKTIALFCALTGLISAGIVNLSIKYVDIGKQNGSHSESATALPTEVFYSKNTDNAPIASTTEADDIKLVQEKLAILEAKIKALEEAEKYASTPVAAITPSPGNAIEKPEQKIFTQKDFGDWLDNSLQFGAYDEVSTQATLKKTEKVLFSHPDAKFDDMQCSQEFCRLTVNLEPGKNLDQTELLVALAEFSETSFTYDDNKESVKIYFVQSKKTMDMLQTDAENDFKSSVN